MEIHHLKMYFLLKMVVFHCYVCLPEGNNLYTTNHFATFKDDEKEQLLLGTKRYGKAVGCCTTCFLLASMGQVTLTTRIITGLVGNPSKPSFATATGEGGASQ